MSDNENDWGDFESDEDGVITDTQLANSIETKCHLKNSYQILDLNDVDKKFSDIVSQVSTHLDLSEWHATLILRYFQWNKQKTIENYFNDPQSIQKKAGISIKNTPPKNTKNTLECPFCYEKVKSSICFYLECGHQVCSQCWEYYIVESINEGKNCIALTCPYYQCGVIISPEFINKIIGKKHGQLLRRYQRFSLEEFIEHNIFLSFCPAPNCSYVIECDPGLNIDIECKCGYISCSKCKLICHRPATCNIAEKWLLKNSSELENISWIIAKTKKCPKCHIPIEKNQGCNHMICKNCSNEFCWLCKGEWEHHGTATGGYYKCNIYEKNQETGNISDEEIAQKDAENELERYTFYYTRYDNHLRSGKLANEKLKDFEKKLNQIMEYGKWDTNDAYFIIDVGLTLVECRRLLAWTYPISYYLDLKYEHRNLFEDLQQQLEKYIEHLHGLIENKIIFNNNKRQEIINYTRVTKTFRNNMMNGIENEINLYFVSD